MLSGCVRGVPSSVTIKKQLMDVRPVRRKMMHLKAVMVKSVDFAISRMTGKYGCLIMMNRPILF